LWSTIRRSEDTRRLATIAFGGGIVGLITAVTAFALNATVAIAIDSTGATASVNPKFIYLLSGVIGVRGDLGARAPCDRGRGRVLADKALPGGTRVGDLRHRSGLDRRRPRRRDRQRLSVHR